MKNWVVKLVGTTGLEPARISPRDPKSRASASSATCPFGFIFAFKLNKSQATSQLLSS